MSEKECEKICENCKHATCRFDECGMEEWGCMREDELTEAIVDMECDGRCPLCEEKDEAESGCYECNEDLYREHLELQMELEGRALYEAYLDHDLIGFVALPKDCNGVWLAFATLYPKTLDGMSDRVYQLFELEASNLTGMYVFGDEELLSMIKQYYENKDGMTNEENDNENKEESE